MKKLIYMLSLTIGLVLAGCAQWEKPEPQSPDNFGAACEMVVTVDSVVTTSSTTLTIETVGAKYVSYLLSESVISNVNYTYILQGKMGAKLTETDVEGEVINTELKNLEAGMVYTLYVVAANEQGRQTTFTQNIQTIDETAPAIKNPLEALKPTKDGLKATVVFNENIKRTEGMGDITYDIFLLDKANKQFVAIAEDALIASASASGANLTVSLPAATEFEMGVDYIVLLSFAEGAVEDLFGNKMAAIENGIVNNKPTGPFWNVLLEEQGEEPDEDENSYYVDGKLYAYAYSCDFEGEGTYYDVGTGFIEWNFLSNIEDEDLGTCKLWAISSPIGIYENNEEAGIYPRHEVTALSYITEVDGYETEVLTVAGIEDISDVCLGQATMEDNTGATFEVDLYPATYYEKADGGYINYRWDFCLFEYEYQGSRYPVSAFYDISGEGGMPVIVFVFEENIYIYCSIDESTLAIYRQDLMPAVESAAVKVLNKPMKLDMDKYIVNKKSLEECRKLAK